MDCERLLWKKDYPYIYKYTQTSLQHLNEEHKNFSEMAANYVSPIEVSLISRQAAFPLHLSSHFVRFDYCVGWPNTVSSTDPDLLCT